MGGNFSLVLDEPRWRFDLPWGTAASFGLHALLLAAIVMLSPLRQLVVPPPQPVAVQIVTQAQFEALQHRTAAPAQFPAPASAPADAAPPAPDEQHVAPTPTQMADLPANKSHTATQFYSASILKEPAMARIRQTLTTFADSERVVQLCNIEGLEQIRRAEPKYDPDTLVGYAMNDFVSAGMTLSAAGGAFRSRRKWYGISYHCTVAPDYEGVTAFEFTIGSPIPEDQWEAHNLNAEDEEEGSP
jgi:hypothetical protein